MPRRRLLAKLVVGVLGVGALAGCSGGGAEETYTVQGAVTVNGKPVEGATVLFDLAEPTASGKRFSARARTDALGRYRLKTFGEGHADGAVAGRYRVAVFPKQEFYGDEAPDPNSPPEIPLRYNDSGTSDLEYEVKPGHNEIDIELE